MNAILTDRQAEELNKAIAAYLGSLGASKTLAAFQEEVPLPASFNDDVRKKYEGIMEKKWTSIVRLQKKVLDLEQRNSNLQEELNANTPTSSLRKNQDPTSWLPRAPARHTLQSHRSPITCVAFHPVFSSLASGSEDTSIKIWDWEMGELERTVKGHTKGVLDVDFGGPRGGTLLASCSSDLTIKLWDPTDEYKNIRTLPGHDHSVSAIRFIPSGAAGAPSSGNLLVSASRDKTLRIWDVTTGYCVKTIRGHVDWVRDVAPSFDGRWLLSGGTDQTARLWDANSGEAKSTFLGHEHVIECVAIAPPVSYAYLATLVGLKKTPPLSSSAEFVATGSRDKTIKIWDGRGTLIKTLAGHDNWVRGLVFHPGGQYLLSVSDDKTIRCWDFKQEGKCVKTISDAHGHFVSCIRWAPNQPKDVPANGDAANGAVVNGTKKKDEEKIRTVIATGSVDLNVRIFAA
ncbi:nuclear distribution protein PAC1 [Bimuria novae-zelandiae CBS 107.79]|uniref:Nuclear distribution protein PAC1 n=1 Tax=Bimuria novae-zelandiae CBS 107.79 TaxID=1447943 RepID=A0A6A5VJU9_9PLEO|nr:nuclear distribution protein PAC1 [Bimuria novae-zelandiae CBS 107.79]